MAVLARVALKIEITGKGCCIAGCVARAAMGAAVRVAV
jgi:hypothetical protein